MTAKMPTVLSGCALAILVLGCAGVSDMVKPKPVPDDKSDYIGMWLGGPITFEVRPDGILFYEKTNGGTSTSLEVPITIWGNSSISAGIGPFATTFAINSPPQQIDGQWTMTVDDQILLRQ